MPIYIRPSTEPLSEYSLQADHSRYESGLPARVIMAASDAGGVLQHELTRYCMQQMEGRSFLIAGHRGAGKTSTVAQALDVVIKKSRHDRKLLRPLPVILHGPSLLKKLSSDNGAGKQPAAQTTPGEVTAGNESAAPQAQSVQPPRAQPDPAKDKADASEREIEKRTETVLVQIVLGLHRAVVKEYTRCFRRRVLDGNAGEPGFHSAQEAGELAAQFEIEITEDPHASTLREFWAHANAMRDGILFDMPRETDQAARELAALNGMCHAHQRISGELARKDSQTQTGKDEKEKRKEDEFKIMEVLKPVLPVLTGAAVGGGAAIGHSLPEALIVGLLTAWGTSLSFKSTTTHTVKRERRDERTFIPDLSIRTLDRIIPALLDRLRQAGLAPVFIVDELDKVGRLAHVMDGMVIFLKKLMAENVFTCFLTDRGYLEHIGVVGRGESYGVAHSCFSLKLLVAYRPREIDQYLRDLLDARPAGGAAPPDAATGDTDQLDFDILRWVLRHRSQLNALALERELTALQMAFPYGNEDALDLRGAMRSEAGAVYQIDLTMQVAIELQLMSSDAVNWSSQRPLMRQTLFDALYYVSRAWSRGATEIVLGEQGKSAFRKYLLGCMNLDEARGGGSDHMEVVTPAAKQPEDLDEKDVEELMTLALGVADFLANTTGRGQAEAVWNSAMNLPGFGARASRLEASVLDTLRLGDEGVLAARAGAEHTFDFRYTPTGRLRDQGKARDAKTIYEEAGDLVSRLTEMENTLWTVLRRPVDRPTPNGAVYALLGDQLRILPVTPAWQQVADGIRRLLLAKDGQGNPSTLESDLQNLKNFEKVALSNREVLWHLLVEAAFMGGFGDATDRASAVRGALEVLSAGLRFRDLSCEEIGRQVERLGTEVRNLYGGLVSLPMPGSSGNAEPGLEAAVDRAWASGIKVAKDCPWSKIVESAWNRLQSRLYDYSDSGIAPPPGVEEVLCAARKRGPAQIPLALNLEEASLHHWSRAWLAALVPASTEGARPPDPTPFWIVVYAMRHLGVASIGAVPMKNLLEAMIGKATVTQEEARYARNLAFERGVWRGEPRNAGTLIVLRRAGRSITNGWTKMPSSVLALVLDAADLERLRTSGEAVLKALPDPVLLACEQPADDPSKEDTQLERLRSTLSPSVKTVWMYERAGNLNQQPAVMAPEGPDELLEAVGTTDKR